MFTGNLPLKIETLADFDKFGQPTVSKIQNTRCSVVKLSTSLGKATVGNNLYDANSFANAYIAEVSSTSKLLVNISAKVSIGDKLTVMGKTLRVSATHVRNDTRGKPHHHEVDCTAWV